MAVKKHELVADNRNQLDLTALAQFFELMNEQPNYLPPPQELVKHCQDIVKCLCKNYIDLLYNFCKYYTILIDYVSYRINLMKCE